MLNPSIVTPWPRLLALGAIRYLPAKFVSLTIGMTGFFYLYFWVMRSPLGQPAIMPLMPPDHWFDVRESAIWLYGSLWVYVPLAAVCSKTPTELRTFAYGSAIMSAIGLSIFWLFPTAVPHFDVDWAMYPMLRFLKDTDVAGNACPSLHVAFAAFAGGTLACLLRRVAAPAWIHALNLLWGLGIAYSTMATRQHVFLDVLSGMLLGCVTFWVTGGRRLAPT